VVVQALALYAKGMDFADALHLASASKSDSLITFDEDFVKKSLKLKTVPVVELL
jgi:predicted nucleic acid-binding protein